MHVPRMRPFEAKDLEWITEIYNHYVRTSIATFDVDPVTPDQYREWVQVHTTGAGHMVWVAEEEGRVVGYAGAGPFRPRPAYGRTVETSVYLDPACTGRGLGSALYDQLFTALRPLELHRAVAVIALPNPPSEALHRRFGFRESGRLTEVGWKFGKLWDVALFERGLS